MTTFDVHQHLWPQEVIEILSERREPPCLRGSDLVLEDEGQAEVDLDEHRLERRLVQLDRQGTDVAVLSLQPTLGFADLPEADRTRLVTAWHEGALRLAADGGGRIRAFAAGMCLEGFAGSCVSAADLVRGGPDFELLVQELAAARQVLFVHPGPGRPPAGAPPWWTAVVDYTAQMQAAYLAWLSRRSAERRPAAIFAFLAGGAPIQLERLSCRGGDESLGTDPSVFFDVSSYGRRALELCLATFGVRQLIFGTDFPVVDPESTLQGLRAFGAAVSTVVREENPSLLLG